MLNLWQTTALNAWDRIGGVEKKIEPFDKVLQGTKKAFADFLRSLTSAENGKIQDSEARK